MNRDWRKSAPRGGLFVRRGILEREIAEKAARQHGIVSLVVETDGYAFHRTRWAQERDRRRDQLLSRSGWRRERFTFRQITADPGWVTSTLLLLLRDPATSAAPRP